jgi:hypothetical protein
MITGRVAAEEDNTLHSLQADRARVVVFHLIDFGLQVVKSLEGLLLMRGRGSDRNGYSIGHSRAVGRPGTT